MTDNTSPARAETPPDRLCVDPSSPYHNADLLRRGIGIRFKGVEKTNVEEYCVSEGWVRLAVGKTLDRHGKQMTVKLKGAVDPYFES
ncbi:MAG: glutathione peroxidase [Phenylobacterium zucineum]|nr:MAG: glutathione peroxidase [Phenylobacterium zucineum]